MLRAFNLVRGLNRATEKEEAEIIAGREIAQVSSMTAFNREAAALKKQLDTRVLELKNDWIEALAHWETLKQESKLLQQAADRRDELAKEIAQARAHVNKRKEAFFAELEALTNPSDGFFRVISIRRHVEPGCYRGVVELRHRRRLAGAYRAGPTFFSRPTVHLLSMFSPQLGLLRTSRFPSRPQWSMIWPAQMNYWMTNFDSMDDRTLASNGPIADLLAVAVAQRLYRQQGQHRAR